MLKRVSFWLYIVFSILALVVALGINNQIQASKHLVSVVETSQNVPAYQPLTSADLTVRQIPESAANRGTVNSIASVLNKFTSEYIPSGVQVTSNMLYTHASTPAEMLKQIGDPNKIMVSIPVQSNDIISEVHVGDTIDIVSPGKTSVVVSATVLDVNSSSLLYVMMNYNDYLSIVNNLAGVRIAIPTEGVN